MRELKFRVWTGNSMWSPEYRSNWEMLRDASDEPHPTVMQFTGLKDKNGTEIYEGDIYSTWGDKSFPRVVEWGHSGFTLPNEEYIEVIGNVYESPELLK